MISILIKKEEKRGIFFSIDALVAMSILAITLFFIFPAIKYPSYETTIPSDIMSTISNLKIGDINNSYAQSLISQGLITDLNKSVLEQIGEFYVTNLTLARNLGDSIFSNLSTKENIGLWFEDTLIASKNSTSFELAENIEIDKQLISGIQSGGSVTGFSAHAFLSKSAPIRYFYFGGYVGDGNISINLSNGGEINDVDIEIAINKDFDIYINGIFSGHYQNSSSPFTPSIYNLGAYIGNFNSGNNIIKISGDNLFVAGGNIKVNYNNLSLYEEPIKYRFPGIEGIINLYDGFFIPNTINEMNINLHMDSNLTVFLTIGNTTVFENSTAGPEYFSLPNSFLSGILNYSDLIKKTIPLRLGIRNVSYISADQKHIDVFSVTDISGSMIECNGGGFLCCLFSGDFCGSNSTCTACGGTFEDKLTVAKDANKVFIDLILNDTQNRVGLAAYSDSVQASDFHNLSNNNLTLKNEVDSWSAGGATCICCGINSAVSSLVNESSIDKSRSIVVMSDGEANVECPQQNTGDASQDAINAACDAFGNFSIKTYTIGFGSDVDITTLQAIATCGNGTYNFGNITNLVSIYQNVSQQIIDVAYNEQTVESSSSVYTELFPDSFIEFNYTETNATFGLTITNEEQFNDTFSGTFSLPPNSSIVETNIISYSGPRWTNNLEINSTSVYNLSEYVLDYVELGDPYRLNIANSFINTTNIIRLTTGTNPTNSTEGSLSNKIIYTVIKDFQSFSTISASADGCTWDIEFEDNTNISLGIPINYTGSNTCNYESSGIIYDSNDAMQSATFDLLTQLDFDSNNKVDVKFTENNFVISASQIFGIPYSWSTDVFVGRWN